MLITEKTYLGIILLENIINTRTIFVRDVKESHNLKEIFVV